MGVAVAMFWLSSFATNSILLSLIEWLSAEGTITSHAATPLAVASVHQSSFRVTSPSALPPMIEGLGQAAKEAPFAQRR